MLKHKGDRITRRSLQHLHRVRLAIASASMSAFVLALLVLSQWSLEQDPLASSTLSMPADPNTLKVVTRIGPTTYFKTENSDAAEPSDAEIASGFEHAMLSRFAASIGKKLEIETVASLDEIFQKLDRRDVHLAAAGLSVTDERAQRFAFATPYDEIRQLVVYRAGNKRPRNINDLAGRDIIVIADSSHAAYLQKLQKDNPAIQWRELRNADYIDILGRIENGEVDYTVMGENEFMLHRGFFPRVKKALALGEPESIAWALPKSFSNSNLHKAANQFIQKLQKDKELAKLREQYFGQAVHVSQVAANEFSKNINRRLPRHIDAIKQVAAETDMDWRMLAAISYQESGWNPKAVSPTGVRGLMMLTLPTAKEVGVSNRLDPMQSLRGGAAYLNNLRRRLPSSIEEPDRSWFALAAYNVGMGHLEDARVITAKRGGDPSSWFDVKKALPLLAKREWYKNTRYGYARGHEPVTYVQNIRHYFNVLVWQDRTSQRPDSIEYEAPLLLGELLEETPVVEEQDERTTLATSETAPTEDLPDTMQSL